MNTFTVRMYVHTIQYIAFWHLKDLTVKLINNNGGLWKKVCTYVVLRVGQKHNIRAVDDMAGGCAIRTSMYYPYVCIHSVCICSINSYRPLHMYLLYSFCIVLVRLLTFFIAV